MACGLLNSVANSGRVFAFPLVAPIQNGKHLIPLDAVSLIATPLGVSEAAAERA
jgi:hypothetical protein